MWTLLKYSKLFLLIYLFTYLFIYIYLPSYIARHDLPLLAEASNSKYAVRTEIIFSLIPTRLLCNEGHIPPHFHYTRQYFSVFFSLSLSIICNIFFQISPSKTSLILSCFVCIAVWPFCLCLSLLCSFLQFLFPLFCLDTFLCYLISLSLTRFRNIYI